MKNKKVNIGYLSIIITLVLSFGSAAQPVSDNLNIEIFSDQIIIEPVEINPKVVQDKHTIKNKLKNKKKSNSKKLSLKTRKRH